VKSLLDSVRLRCNFRCSLVLAAAVAMAVYKARVVHFSRPLELFLACAVDALAWTWLLCVSEVGARWKATAGRAIGIAFFPLFYVLLTCDVTHTTFYDVAMERRFSLLDVDPASVAFFLANIVTMRWLVAVVSFALGIHVVAWWVSSRGYRFPARAAFAGLCVATLVTTVVAVFAPRVPSPLFDTARDAYDLMTLARVVPRTPPRLDDSLAALDKSDPGDDVRPPRFSKILVFVMETVPTVDFEAERAALPEKTFFRTVDAHAHRYDRYYATNQDSRTGMLDMLGSRLVPYEAYTEYGLAHYRFLSQKSSLVRDFNRLGYATAYAASHADREAVLRDMPWRLITLPESRVRASSAKFLCVTRYEFEHGCEDKALLPDVLDFVDSHERVFLFQEFIWGHDPEYNQMSGRTNADYYSSYLDALIDHLKARGELDDTLIVLTSDHGFRSRARLDRVESYELPLLFYSTRYAPERNAELRSHLDFKDLLFHEVGSRDRPEDVNPFVMNVGPTGAGTLAVIGPDRGVLLLRMRENLAFVLADHRNLRPSISAEDSRATLLGGFLDYRRRFDAFGQAGAAPRISVADR
jgi:hypothetical protein